MKTKHKKQETDTNKVIELKGVDLETLLSVQAKNKNILIRLDKSSINKIFKNTYTQEAEEPYRVNDWLYKQISHNIEDMSIILSLEIRKHINALAALNNFKTDSVTLSNNCSTLTKSFCILVSKSSRYWISLIRVSKFFVSISFP